MLVPDSFRRTLFEATLPFPPFPPVEPIAFDVLYREIATPFDIKTLQKGDQFVIYTNPGVIELRVQLGQPGQLLYRNHMKVPGPAVIDSLVLFAEQAHRALKLQALFGPVLMMRGLWEVRGEDAFQFMQRKLDVSSVIQMERLVDAGKERVAHCLRIIRPGQVVLDISIEPFLQDLQYVYLGVSVARPAEVIPTNDLAKLRNIAVETDRLFDQVVESIVKE